MGLLSLLSKKPSGEIPSRYPSLHSQAYHTTAARSPPVRGAYPVAGNGPHPLETLSRASGQLDWTPDQSPTLSEYFAPYSVGPRSRGGSQERPSTAPDEEWPQTRRRQDVDRIDPPARLRKNPSNGRSAPVSFRMPRDRSVASDRRGSRSSSIGTAVAAPSQPTTPPFGYSHSRNSSVRSGSHRAFKDILDAQSEFKPSDFRSRVKAAGARDYGEDVADRNITLNGANHESVATAKSDYPNQAGQLAPRGRWASMADMSLRSPDVRALDGPLPAKIPLGPARRISLPNTRAQHQLPGRSTSHIPPVPSLSPRDSRLTLQDPHNRKNRRQTVTYYTSARSPPPALDGVQKPAFRGRSKTASREHTPSASGHGQISVGTPNPKHGWAHEIPSSPPPRRRPGPRGRDTQRMPRDSVVLTRNKIGLSDTDHADDDDDNNVRHVPTRQQEKSFVPRRLSGDGSVAPPPIPTRGRRHSLQPLRPSTRRSNSIVHAPPGPPRIMPAKSEPRIATGREDIEISPTDSADYAPFPLVSRAGPRPHEKKMDDSNGYARTNSLTPSLQKLKIDDSPAEAVPIKGPSARHWSISSATPTTSDASSNPFPRPQSHHTANTSVDLGNAYSVENSSQNSLPSATTSPNHAALPPLTTKKSATFNIDDYISSDDDDIVTPQRPRGEGEEDLLFHDDGYGMGGSQLPGLFDSLPAPTAKMAFNADPHALARQGTIPQTPYGGSGGPPFGTALWPPRGPRNYIIDTAAHYDDDGDDDDDSHGKENEKEKDDNKDGLDEEEDTGYDGTGCESQSPCGSPIRSVRGTKRLSALGTMYGRPSPRENREAIPEEQERGDGSGSGGGSGGKIDVAAAIKRRKEWKARKRATMVADRRSQLKSDSQATVREDDR